MQDQDKTKDQLIHELNEMRRKVKELEATGGRLVGMNMSLGETRETCRQNLSDLICRDHLIDQEGLSNVINISKIQSLMDDFYKLTNIGIAILDLKGNVLVATGWQDICTQYHRVHPETLRNCTESDLHLTENVAEGEYLLYKCKNNMWDMVTPVVMAGKHVGNLFLGQFFFEDEVPEVEVFIAQAQRYGFDKDEYLAALQRVPRWSRDKVRTVMTFYSKFASMVGELSYNNVMLGKTLIECKMVEGSLRESEQMVRGILSASPVGIALTSHDRRIEWVNEAWLRIFGFENEDECLGKTTRMLYPSDEEFGRIRNEVYPLLEREKVSDIKVRMLRRDGVPLDAHIRLTALDSSDLSKGIIATIEDITERKRAEGELRASEARYRSLFDHMSNAVAVYRAAKEGDDFVLVDFNEAASKIEQIPRSQIIGRSVLEVFPGVKEFGLFEVFQRVWRTGKAEHYPIKEYRDNRIQGWRDNFVYKLPSGELVTIYSDETQRKRAEAALRESEKRWQFALEGSGDGVWDWNAQTNQVFFSRQWKAMLGYGEDEIGDGLDEWDKLVHPDDKDRCYADLDKHFRGETPEYRNEHRLLCKDGTYKWILDRGKVIEWTQEGRPLRVIGTHSDMTELKRAEAGLRDSEERFRLAMEATSDGVWDWDMRTNEVYRSPRFFAMLGYDPEDFPSGFAGWEGMVHSDDLGATLSCLENYLTGKSQKYEVEFRMLNKQGEPVWILSRGKVVARDRKGKPLRMVGTHMDITDLKKSESALRESEERYRMIFNNAPVGIMHFDRNGVILDFNEKFSQIIGAPREKILGFNMRERLQDQEMLEAVQTCLDGNIGVYEGDYVSVSAGKMTPIRTTYGSIVSQEGKFLGAVGIFEDITGRRQAEENIRKLSGELERRVRDRTARLEAANEDLKTFAHSVSHDLRAPLRAISGFAQIISNRYCSNLSEEALRYFGYIVQASTQMDNLIKDLLTYSRIGRQSVQKIPVNFADVVSRVVIYLDERIINTKAQIVSEGELPVVSTDPNLIERIFLNVMENALTYVRPGVSPRIVVSAECEQEHVMMKISDNGIGIPPEFHEKVFQIFQRLHRQEEYPGTGLGLAVVKKSVELLGGKVIIQSTIGEGSTICFTVPR